MAAVAAAAYCIAAQNADHESARQLLTSGRAAEAAAIYRELLRADSDNTDLMLNLSIAEYTAGNFRDAADIAAGALKRAPDLLPAQLFLGASYLELGEFAKAVEALDRVVKKDARDRNARVLLAQARAKLQDAAMRWRESAAEWSEAFKLAPENPKVRFGLAWALFRSRDYDAAMAAIKPLLSDPAAQFLFGASLLNLGQPADAMPYLRNAVSGDPSLLPARAALGQALLQTGKSEEAIPYLKEAASSDQEGSVRFQLFRAYQLTGRKAEADQALADYQRFKGSIGRAQ
jgi:predicted Zn-dependent protease